MRVSQLWWCFVWRLCWAAIGVCVCVCARARARAESCCGQREQWGGWSGCAQSWQPEEGPHAGMLTANMDRSMLAVVSLRMLEGLVHS